MHTTTTLSDYIAKVKTSSPIFIPLQNGCKSNCFFFISVCYIAICPNITFVKQKNNRKQHRLQYIKICVREVTNKRWWWHVVWLAARTVIECVAQIKCELNAIKLAARDMCLTLYYALHTYIVVACFLFWT